MRYPPFPDSADLDRATGQELRELGAILVLGWSFSWLPGIGKIDGKRTRIGCWNMAGRGHAYQLPDFDIDGNWSMGLMRKLAAEWEEEKLRFNGILNWVLLSVGGQWLAEIRSGQPVSLCHGHSDDLPGAILKCAIRYRLLSVATLPEAAATSLQALWGKEEAIDEPG